LRPISLRCPPYGVDERGRPVFLISTMAMHTQNLKSDPRASLLVTRADGGGDLGASRLTVTSSRWGSRKPGLMQQHGNLAGLTVEGMA